MLRYQAKVDSVWVRTWRWFFVLIFVIWFFNRIMCTTRITLNGDQKERSTSTKVIEEFLLFSCEIEKHLTGQVGQIDQCWWRRIQTNSFRSSSPCRRQLLFWTRLTLIPRNILETKWSCCSSSIAKLIYSLIDLYVCLFLTLFLRVAQRVNNLSKKC